MKTTMEGGVEHLCLFVFLGGGRDPDLDIGQKKALKFVQKWPKSAKSFEFFFFFFFFFFFAGNNLNSIRNTTN